MEKVLGFKSQVILGPSSQLPGCFATAETYVPLSEEALKKRGKLFVVATLKGPSHFAVEEAGRLVLDALQAEYFSLLEGSPLPALEKAVAAAHRRLLDLLHGPSLTNKEGADFNLVAAVLWGQILYLAKLGTAVVYLLREGTLAEIGTAAEAQVSVASGLVGDKDVLILGSASFREQFPPHILQNNLENLEELIRKKERRESLAALVVSLFFEEAVAEGEVVKFVSWPQKTAGRLESRWPSLTWRWPLDWRRLSLSWRNFWHHQHRRLPIPPAGIYLDVLPPAERRKRRRRHWVLAALLVAVFFLASAIFTLQRSQRQRVNKELVLLGVAVEQKVLSAGDFLDLNNQKASEMLNEALSDAEKITRLGDRARGEDLRAQIETLLIKVNKVQADIKVSLIYDFAVQGKESRPRALSGGEGVLYVADIGTNALYRLDITASPPKVEQLGSGEITQVRLLTGGDDYLYGLAADGLFRMALAKRTVKTDLGGDLTGRTVTDLAYYFGNLYLLQAAENNFVKYTPTTGGLSAPLTWLKEKADLTGAISLAVDGDVYFLFKDSSLKKLTAGKATDFKLVNLDKPLLEAQVVYTRADLNELYILDTGNKRVVLADKNGFYRKQIPLTNTMFSAPTAFWVDAGGGALYLLDGTRLLALELADNL